jgi:hypothetical protein
VTERPVPDPETTGHDELADPSETDQPAEGGRAEAARLPGADTPDGPPSAEHEA